MPYRGRFAPSPTGHLHAGSLVAAVASWLCARRAGGAWLLRVEDIDPPREVAGSAQSILASLQRYGLIADAPPMYQSRRGAAYAQALQRLREAGHVFPCWCSRSDLAAHAGMHRDGHCVRPADAERQPAWRIHAPDLEIAFEDAVQGPQRQNLREAAGDFVLRRADGFWAYQLACVVDDGAQGITEVVRGCDLLDSTPRQIFLQRLLGLPEPRYLHVPLAVDARGRKLSKSAGAMALDRDDPVATLRRALRFLGTQAGGDSVPALLDAAARHFDPARIPARAACPWPPLDRGCSD